MWPSGSQLATTRNDDGRPPRGARSPGSVRVRAVPIGAARCVRYRQKGLSKALPKPVSPFVITSLLAGLNMAELDVTSSDRRLQAPALDHEPKSRRSTASQRSSSCEDRRRGDGSLDPPG